MVPRLAALAAIAIGCGGDNDAAIAIDGAPRIALTEGALASVRVSINPPPETGACAAPLADTSLVAEIEGRDASELFDVFTLRSDAGELVLDLEPRCNLMGPGDPDRLFELAISSPSGCARAATARLRIASAPATGCGPRVLAWSGDCSVAPEDAGLAVAISATPDPDPLCVSIRSRDPGRETLAIRSDTNFPGHVLLAGDLPTADGVEEAALFTIPLADTTNLAGSFGLDYFLFFGEVAGGVIADFEGTIGVVVGDADLAIDVPPQLEPVGELSVAQTAVRLWGPGRGGPVPLCARASRVDPGFTPIARAKPFLLLDNPLTGDASVAGFVCGEDLRLKVSPPVDALEVEQVLIEAAYCDACDSDPAPIITPVTRVIDVETESHVEQTTCAGNTSNVADLACADITGDDTPEVVFAGRGGPSPATCAFAGDKMRLADLPFAAGSDDPDRLGSFVWRDPDNGPTPIILGSFSTGDLIRRLSVAGGEASWAAATELGIEAIDTRLDLIAPLAEDPVGGATHLARFDAARTGIEITCVTPNDPVITGCTDLSLANVIGAGQTFRGIAGIDLDGDGDQDLIAYEGTGAGESAINLHLFRLSWPTADAPQIDDSFTDNTGFDAGTVGVAVVDDPDCATPPCRQFAVAVHQGIAHGNAAGLFTKLDAAEPLANANFGVEPLLGPSRSATRVGDVGLVASAFGVAVPSDVGVQSTSFKLADPVLIEEQLVNPIDQQRGIYGVDLVGCAGVQVPTFAFPVGNRRVRVVRSDVRVQGF